MYERLCVNAKIEPSLNFYVYAQTFIHSLYFIYVRKINARTHVKITRLWKPTLRCLSHTGHCLIFDWRVLSPKSRTFSPNDIYLKNGGRKGLANQFMFRTFFSSSDSLVDESSLIQISSSSGLFVLVIRLYKVNFVSVSHVD